MTHVSRRVYILYVMRLCSIKMSFNDVYRQYMEFREVWRSNVQDVRRLALKTLKCVLMGPTLFGCVTCICLYESNVVFLKIVKFCIYI